MSVFDFVVVGGGSSGCVAAAELARANVGSVLLLECGAPAEDNPETLRADGYKTAFANDRVIWERFSAPQASAGGNRIFMGSGTGMGGSGSVNGMVYTRGAREDYAEWPTGWRWDDVAPHFAQLESVLRPNRRAPTELLEACIASAEQAGFQRKDDLNDGALGGVIGYEWMNYEGDARRSSYVAFIKDQRLPNLTVRTGARAESLDLEGRRVTGVTYLEGETRHRVTARREVILCAGALETPKLLMLSGIGPAEALRSLDIPVALDAPGVGGNLHDHPNVPLFHLGRKAADAFYPQLYSFHRANPASTLPRGQSDTCYVFWPARSSMKEAMKRILPGKVLPPRLYRTPLHGAVRRGVDLAFAARPVESFVERMYGIIIILGKPKSRGRLSLRSRDVREEAHLDPAYYSVAEDMETMIAGVRLARRVASGDTLSSWGNRELMPGRRVTSDEGLRRFIEDNTITTYHFAGTCRMGEDRESVVDTSLRFRGLEGLRIGDASVIPSTPVSALNAPSMLVGLRAAQLAIASAEGRKSA